MQRQMFREEEQAKNIIKNILKKDPKAKIIIHGGRDHIAEIYEMQSMGADSFRIGVMAGAFKYFSGINPFTIDQMRHAEHSKTAFESSIFQWWRKQKKVMGSSIFVNKKTGSFLTDGEQLYDLTIVPSPAKYIDGRPDWLVDMPQRKKLYIDVSHYQPGGSEYFMVQAIYANEDQYAYLSLISTILPDTLISILVPNKVKSLLSILLPPVVFISDGEIFTANSTCFFSLSISTG